MLPRQRVLTALQRQTPDRPPFFFGVTAPVYREFQKRTGHHDIEEYFDMDIRTVKCNPTKLQQDYSPYYVLPAGATCNEWGIGLVKGSGYDHFEDMIHPLQQAQSISDIENYPWPDVGADYRIAGLKEIVDDYHRRGYAVRIEPPIFGGTVFETAWGLRGMEQLLVDLVINPDFAAALLDKVTSLSMEMAVLSGRTGADVFVTGDDVGTQKAMLMSPEMWREWFKPRLAKVIQAAKDSNPDMFVFYHSCGHIMPIIDDLIEIGVDVLNPIQPETMDLVEVKQRFGDRIAFWGGIGTQTVMPFGTPEDVRTAVRELCELMGKDGGLVVAPTHVLEPEVPWENIVALHEAVLNYRY